MTFVILIIISKYYLHGVLVESASSEPKSQLKKNQAELLVLNQQVEKPIKAGVAAKLSLCSWPFPTVKKDLFCLLGW